jgi:hypothetical protein
MDASATSHSPVASSRWPTRSNLNAISFVALISAAVFLGAGAISFMGCLGETVDVDLVSSVSFPLQAPPTGGVATWPAPGGSGSAAVTSGAFTSAHVSVSGLSIGVRALLASGQFVATLTAVLIALAVSYLCQRLRNGDPFVPTLTKVMYWAAWVLMIGGLTGPILTGIGDFYAAAEIAPNPAESPFVPTFALSFTAPICGLVLGVIAAAFRVGERMQRDTEGLV